MAPKPAYQLLIWSVPTVAFLLTCLWYRRKRNSFRSDPGGTASVDLTALPLKKPDPRLEPATKLSESQSQSAQQGKANEKDAFPAATDSHTEVGSIEDSCRKTEIDSSVTSVQRENRHTPENHSDLRERSFFREENFTSLQTGSRVKSEPVVLKSEEELEKNREASEEIEEEVECKGKTEEESECSDKSNKEAIHTTESKVTDCKETTTLDCEIQESEHLVSINNVQVLSQVASEDISDKIVDISNFQGVQESYSATKPSRQTVFIPDSLSEKLAEEKLCISSSDKCVVTNGGAEPECIEEDCESTALQSSLCESCGISDSALTKQNSEDSCEEVTVTSVVNTSELGGEAGCVNSAGRTVMARKSSTDLPMERSADSDGAATHRESNLPVSEQRKTGAENVQVERDSANHSPADVMLGSPAISNYSDANSEGSSDSGKGCSDMATPPPRTPASGSSLAGDVPSIYEFVLPQHLVGRLIGRYGAFVHQIKDKTNANIFIKKHPDTTKLKICAIEGNQMGIDRAVEMIREKFPLKKYPNVTLEQVCFVPAAPVFPVPQCVQLPLVEGVNNDVIVSYMVTPAHVFLQQPTHPTFLNLSAQAAYMQACYSEPTVPALPRPVAADVICVAPVVGDWCRAQVVTDEAEDGTCTMRLLDYGGYDVVDCSLLRQIRQDFMLLPFQAAEAYLANISPAGGAEEDWSQEAFEVLEELTKGQVVEAQVVGYAENGVPIVYLYSIVRSKAIFVNYELVKRGLAEWTDGCTVVNGNATDRDLTEESARAVAAEH